MNTSPVAALIALADLKEGEQFASDSSFAWFQNFYYGGTQDGFHETSELRARAVRRLKIT